MKFRCFPCFLCLSPSKSQGMRKSHLEKKHGLFVPTKLENAGCQTPGNIIQIQELNKSFVAQNKLVRDILSQCTSDISSWEAKADKEKNVKRPESFGETPKHTKPPQHSESLDLSANGTAESRNSQNTLKESKSDGGKDPDLHLENPVVLDLTCNKKTTTIFSLNGSSSHVELDRQPDCSLRLDPTFCNVNFSYLMQPDSKHGSSNTLTLAKNNGENVVDPESKSINFMEVDFQPGIPKVTDTSDQNMVSCNLPCETQRLQGSSSACIDLTTCTKSQHINLTSQTSNSLEENNK